MATEQPGVSTARRGAWALVCVAGVAVLSVALYAASIHAAPGNSDGASVILEGQAFAGGNLTLEHWALSLDSWWLVDVLLYALATALVGVRPELLHLVPAVAAALVVVTGAWIAQRHKSGAAAMVGAGSVVVLLGLPTHALAQFFLMGPLHVVTTLWCLLAFVGLRRGRYGLGFALSICFLAAAMLGDLQAAVLGVAPVALAGALCSLRARQLRRGLPAIAAAAGSVLLTIIVRLAASLVGTFSLSHDPSADLHEMLLNIRHIFRWGAALGGAGSFPFGAPSVPRLLEVLHGFGVALGVFALAIAAYRVLRPVVGIVLAHRPAPAPDVGSPAAEEAWWSDVLVLAFVGSVAIFVVLAASPLAAYGRYLTSAVVFGSVLAGRLAGRLTEIVFAPGLESRRRIWRSTAFRAATVVLSAAVVAGYVATFVDTLSVAAPPSLSTGLARYLERHHLERGIGDYWSASIVTVDSDEHVVVRPVIASVSDRLVRYTKASTSTWYTRRFQFLVYNLANPWGGVDLASATSSFGRPVEVRAVGTYRVLTWGRELRVPPSGGSYR